MVDSVVGDKVESLASVGRCLSRPKHRTEEEVVESEGVILSNDLAVDVRKPEENGKDGNTETGKDDSESDGGL